MSPPDRPAAARADRLYDAVAGVVLVGAVLATLHWADIRSGSTPHAAFLANVAGVFAVAVGLAFSTRGDRIAMLPPFERWELYAVVAVTLVGAIMRSARWDVFPPADGQLLEEPQTAWNAVRSIRFGHLDLSFPLIDLVGEVGFRMFDRTMTGLRIPFVVLGILSVPIFYLAARDFLRTSHAALFVTALFATNSMLAGSSRIALETMHAIATTVVAMAVTFRAGRRPTVGNCALAGAFNGLLLTEYDSYRIVAVLSLIFLVMQFAVDAFDRPRRDGPAARRAGIASLANLFVFVGFVAAIEASRTLISESLSPFEFLGEAVRRHGSFLQEHRAVMTWGQVLAEEFDKWQSNVQFLFLRGDRADILPPSMGLFDPYTGALGVVAFGFCVARARRNPLRLFPVIAVALLTVLSSVLVGTVARYRLLPVIPFALLLIGALVEAIGHAPRARRWVDGALVVIAIGIASVNVQRFFGVAIWDAQVQATFYDLSMVLSHEISGLQREHPDAPVFLLSDQVHLGGTNDYAFWYDYESVHVFDTPAALRGHTGYLLAHDQFIPRPEDLPTMRDCRQWKTKFDRNVLLCCRLASQTEVEAGP